MISRDEAYSLWVYNSGILTSKQFNDRVDKIYDSIGSCVECRHLHTDRCPIEGYVDRDYSRFFCADFERKTDD